MKEIESANPTSAVSNLARGSRERKVDTTFLNFHPLRKMQLELLEQDGLRLGRLSDAAFADNDPLLRRQDDIDDFNLGDLVEHLPWFIAQKRRVGTA